MILALDLATNIGWAKGDGSYLPLFGSYRLPKTGDDVGQFLLAYEQWFGSVVAQVSPSLVVFETPILPGTTSFKTVTKLQSIAGLTELLCLKAGVKCRSVQPTVVKKSWTGKGNAKKPDMMARAQALGFDVTDNDQADAIAIWFHAQSAIQNKSIETLMEGWRHG
jgi:Holliday junction resolvasome RuvABC endonuclease subunit